MSSTLAELTRSREGDEPDDVLFHSLYGVRLVELNRPAKFNALNASMARKILPRLKVGEPIYIYIPLDWLHGGGGGEKGEYKDWLLKRVRL